MNARTLPIVVVLAFAGCRCSKADEGIADAPSTTPSAASGAAPVAASGLSAPIAATHLAGGDVLVAGLDVPSRSIRVRRIDAHDAVVAERSALGDVKWSSDADLKLVAAPTAGGGAALTWRGLRGGKLGRALVVLGADLVPSGPPVEVAAGSCATREAIWFTDGRRAYGRPWRGAPIEIDLPKEKEPSIACGATRAYALLEEDDGSSMMPLVAKASPVRLLRDADFSGDEQREQAEYTVGDELGVVRLGASGSLAVREVKDGAPGPVKRLATKIPREDDVVAVDASAKQVVVVYTHDVGAACSGPGGEIPSSKVVVVRVDRSSGEETTFELSSGRCGREVGPFFTGAVGDGVSVAWVEREAVAGKPRAPIVALAHAFVPPAGAAETARAIDVAADALVDGGCDDATCYAAVLERGAGTDGMVPGPVRVIRYR